MTVEEKLDHILAMLAVIAGQQQVKEWLSTSEFAMQVGRAEFTVRQWCRLGRIVARRKASGRGKHCAYAISRHELERYQKEGLLPVS